MRQHGWIAALLVISGSIATTALAAGQATREDAIALAHKVEERLKTDGPEKTFAAITAKEFNDRDMYPAIVEIDGVMLAHGGNAAIVGKKMTGVKDPNGRSPGQEMEAVAKTGAPGWVEYSWPNPITKKIEDKTSYVDPIAGTNYYVAVGIYK
jgi:signal transduction histidine kinase